MTHDFLEDLIEKMTDENQPFILAVPVAGKGWRVAVSINKPEHGEHRITKSDAAEMMGFVFKND